MRFSRRSAAVSAAGVFLALGAVAPSGAWAAPQAGDLPAATSATTAARERLRVDRVQTPQLDWYKCYTVAECATVQLPLDYDKPTGETVELAVLRVRAKDQKNKLGSLFVNPGGPGGSGTSLALSAPTMFGQNILDRFDVVGFDPRGVGASANLQCFKSTKEQTVATYGLAVPFPFTKQEETAYIGSVRAVARACSTTGKKLAGAMSTAEAARDMDVLRRAVGDKKLTYLGFSYGTVLGQYYANMFPDRFRAVAIDGVVDPVTWVGDGNANQIQDDRLRSADGAYRALVEIFQRCGQAGPDSCSFARAGDPLKNFDTIARSLRKDPLVMVGGGPNGTDVTLTYPDFINGILGDLYAAWAGDLVIIDTSLVWDALAESGASPAARKAAEARLADRIKQARAKTAGRDFDYVNAFEAASGVACTDGKHPASTAQWPALTAQADRRVPYFGRAWGWNTAQCAGDVWTVRDEDSYLGPFNVSTAAPVLIVGNRWDPATNYDQAVAVSRLIPQSGLLTSDSWGHTAYGSSSCVTSAMEQYLLTGVLPERGLVCQGDYQPFPSSEEGAPAIARARLVTHEFRPHIVDQLPISVLNGNR